MPEHSQLAPLKERFAYARKFLPNMGAPERAYFVAQTLLMELLGEEWVEKHVSGPTAPANFLRNEWSSVENSRLSMIRAIELAEMLFNLGYYVQGMRGFLSRLKVSNLESGFAELEAAKIIAFSGFTAKFVVPTGRIGTDYDLVINLGGRSVCADVKCKLEETAPGKATILRSLKKGRTQLPADLPGMLFVKLPQSWITNGIKSHLAVMQEAAEELWRHTERLVSITYYHSVDELSRMVLIQPMGNPCHRFDKNFDWLVPSKSGMQRPSSWVDLINLAL